MHDIEIVSFRNPDAEEPEEGDYTTFDHRRFYQYDRFVLEVGEGEDFKKRLREHMDAERFWPNVWLISDHGNCHLLEV